MSEYPEFLLQVEKIVYFNMSTLVNMIIFISTNFKKIKCTHHLCNMYKCIMYSVSKQR